MNWRPHLMISSTIGLVAIAALSSCGVTVQSICDKGGISSVAGAMGRSSVIVVVQPVSGPTDYTYTSGSYASLNKRFDVRVVRYLYGSGPETITVSQAYNCGSSRDRDYTDLKQDQQYLLFLTPTTPGNWGPFAVPMGFKVDEQGNLRALHADGRSIEDPTKWVVPTTLEGLASQIEFLKTNTPTPAPRIPAPEEIFKSGLVLNFSQIFAIDKGIWFKASALPKQAGGLSDPDTFQRLAQALNVPLTFEPSTKAVPLGGDILIVGFWLPQPVLGVDGVAFDYSPADGVLANPIAVPVQVTLPEEARRIINEALGVQ